MARVKSLRTRATKDSVEDLRQRCVNEFKRKRISRVRFELLMAILDTFERESFLPKTLLAREVYQESTYKQGIDMETQDC